MTKTQLAIVSTNRPETAAQRIRKLQAEAKELAKAHTKDLILSMNDLGEMATEIADGGDAYSPGIRELASRLADHLEGQIQTLEAIAARS